MGKAFDPYLQLVLGFAIRSGRRIIIASWALRVFEADPDVIAMAADRQMTHLRTLQAGAQAELSQKILNELSAARVCLLKPDRKAAYDEQLRRQMAARSCAVVEATATKLVAAVGQTPAIESATAASDGATRPATASSQFPDFSDLDSFRGGGAVKKKFTTASRAKTNVWPWIAVAGVAAALAVGVAIWRGANDDQSDEHATTSRSIVAQSANDNSKSAPAAHKTGLEPKLSGDGREKEPSTHSAKESPPGKIANVGLNPSIPAKAATVTPTNEKSSSGESSTATPEPPVSSHPPAKVDAPNQSGTEIVAKPITPAVADPSSVVAPPKSSPESEKPTGQDPTAEKNTPDAKSVAVASPPPAHGPIAIAKTAPKPARAAWSLQRSR